MYYPGVGVGVAGGVSISKMLKFYVKVFYVMVKALSGELSCPCDRSCFFCFVFGIVEVDIYIVVYLLKSPIVNHWNVL